MDEFKGLLNIYLDIVSNKPKVNVEIVEENNNSLDKKLLILNQELKTENKFLKQVVKDFQNDPRLDVNYDDWVNSWKEDITCDLKKEIEKLTLELNYEKDQLKQTEAHLKRFKDEGLELVEENKKLKKQIENLEIENKNLKNPPLADYLK